MALVVDGVLAGALYALVAVAFVVVYKASRVMNFALGEWMMLGSSLAAAGVHLVGLSVAGALALACGVMVVMAVTFNRVVLAPLVGAAPIGMIMVTIGLGALMRGAAALVFAGVPAALALPVPAAPLSVAGVPVAAERLVAAVVASVCVVAVTVFFAATRTGLALRALSDDPGAAMVVGIDVRRHLSIAWGLGGGLAVVAGTLWTLVSGGGFSVVLMGLRVFPVVILGGLDSVPGTILAAVLVGVLESLAAGYADPWLGAGFSSISSYVVLLGVLLVRPHGLLGRVAIERI